MSGSMGGRPTKEQAKAGFESEVLRLYRAGKVIGNKETPGTISAIMDADRTTIWRVIKRASDKPSMAAEIQKDREYHQETADQFFSEPAVKDWIEDMKLRRVGKWREAVGLVKRMCEELQIYPDQLVPMLNADTGKRDFTWSKKWLASKSDVSLEILRGAKIAFRGFAKKYGATDYELELAGFDAKHYGVGKWKHVQMSEDQIAASIAYLSEPANFTIDSLRGYTPNSVKGLGEGREEALFAFRFGVETCRTLEPIWNITADQFYQLDAGAGQILYAANLFRKKTEKSGAAYKTAYMAKKTFELAGKLGKENGNGRILNGFQAEQIYPFLRQTYAKVGAHASDPDDPSKDYFQEHPIHALRHSGAQRLLQKTGYNRAVVAELGGWEAEKTLEDHYGGVPQDIIRGIAGSIL